MLVIFSLVGVHFVDHLHHLLEDLLVVGGVVICAVRDILLDEVGRVVGHGYPVVLQELDEFLDPFLERLYLVRGGDERRA